MKCEWCQSELKPGATKCKLCGREVDPEYLAKEMESQPITAPIIAPAPVPAARPVQPVPQPQPQPQANSPEEFVPAAFPQSPVPMAYQQPQNEPMPIPHPTQPYPPVNNYMQPIVLGPQPSTKVRQKTGLAISGVVCSAIGLVFLILALTIPVDEGTSVSIVNKFEVWSLFLWTGFLLFLLGVIFLCIKVRQKNCRVLAIVGLALCGVALILFAINISHYSSFHDAYEFARRYGRYADYVKGY